MADAFAGEKKEESPGDFIGLIVSASADGIVAVDDKGIIRLCNPAAEELAARPAAQLVGSAFGFPLAEGATDIDLVLPGGRSQVVEMRVTSATWEDKRLHVVALRDVSRRRKLEQELQATLERQNIVVAVAAHELRNPLAAIAVLADVLRDRQARLSDQQRAQAIDRIAERTNYLQALVRKLLTAARIDTTGAPSAPEPVQVLALVLECLTHIDAEKLDLRLSCNPKLVALVDRAEFAEMLTNYLENALAHGRPPIAIRVTGRRGFIEIRVCDSGPGVPQSFVPRLFERYGREPLAQRHTEGTGLGLWIVRNLAQANGGEAWYEPGQDGGACFCLRLPRTRSRPQTD